jgi:plastocyanin
MFTSATQARLARKSRALLAIGAVTLAAGLAACGTTPSSAASGPSGAGASSTIVIKNFAFAPDSLTVKPGSTVSVKNEDNVTHTLSSTTGKFNTGNVTSGQTAHFTAPMAPGTYSYRCDIHQYMTGTLVVRAG